MEILKIIKKLLLSPSEIYEEHKKISINHLLIIFITHVALSSITITSMPYNFGDEFSKKALQIGQHSVGFYFLILFTFHLVNTSLFSELFILFKPYLTTKGKIVIILFLNIFLFYFYYLFLRKYFIVNWLIPISIVIAALLLLKKYKDDFLAVFKISILLTLIEIIFSPIFLLCIKINNYKLYEYAQIIPAIWILILFINFSRKNFGISVLNAFFSAIFSGLNSIFISYTLKNAGIINNEIFKISLLIQ